MRIALMLMCCLAFPALADDTALETLQQRLAGMHALRGSFEQRVVSATGAELERSSGTLSLLQPDFFRWHILQPDEQLLLAAGGNLWHYDVELETVTRRDIPVDSPYSPLAILGGDSERLGNHYSVESTGEQAWRLVPTFAEPDFTAIVLRFDGAVPVSMEVTDQLERTTLISFGGLEINPPLAPADFDFSPPPGVDVYDHER
jgi:outer membrane lipoprotein carrier protein